MTPATLAVAIHAAQEFLRQAKLVPTETVTPDAGEPLVYLPVSKHAAAAKRASLDLTRALADMRRAGS